MEIWSIARPSSASVYSAAEDLVPVHEIFAPNDLVLAARLHSAQYASSGKIAVRTKRKLHVPRSLSKLGPAHRIRLQKSSAIAPRVLGRYIKDAPHDNFLKKAKVSLPGMASAFRGYAAFCELRKVTPCPSMGRRRFGGVAFPTTQLRSGIMSLAGEVILPARPLPHLGKPHVRNTRRTGWGNV